MPNEETAIVVNPTEKNIEIIPFGSDEAIKLNVAIVQNMIAVPTKSGKRPDATQSMKFMMLCKARHLNPFEGDAFLLGYDTQDGPQFSLITAHQVFLKRAEASEQFDGMESGVIVREKASEDGLIGLVTEREGDFIYDDEMLLGGWAKVYRKDRSKPFYRRIKLATFNTGRSRWAKDPAGMIVKCAEADSLRSAFPTHLGGLYLKEERDPIDVTATVIPPNGTASKEIKFGAALPEPTAPPTEPEPAPQKRHRRTKAEIEAARQAVEPPPVEAPTAEEKPAAPPAQDQGPFSTGEPESTPLATLRVMFTKKGIEETKFQRFLIMEGYIEPSDKLERLPNAKTQEIVDSFDSILPAFLETQPK